MAQLQPYCAIEGNDDGLPVVFVHGMGVDHRSLMMLDKAFDGNDSIRRIYLDLPGFGRTPALPEHACGLPEMADCRQSAIDGLVGLAAPFAIGGYSMGGALVREVHGGEESVFLARQDVVAQRNARRDEVDDAPLDDFLRRFGVQRGVPYSLCRVYYVKRSDGFGYCVIIE